MFFIVSGFCCDLLVFVGWVCVVCFGFYVGGFWLVYVVYVFIVLGWWFWVGFVWV